MSIFHRFNWTFKMCFNKSYLIYFILYFLSPHIVESFYSCMLVYWIHLFLPYALVVLVDFFVIVDVIFVTKFILFYYFYLFFYSFSCSLSYFYYCSYSCWLVYLILILILIVVSNNILIIVRANPVTKGYPPLPLS